MSETESAAGSTAGGEEPDVDENKRLENYQLAARSRLCRSVLVRILYACTLFVLTLAAVVMYEGRLAGSTNWVFVTGAIALLIEGIVTNKLTHGFDWKWYSPSTVIFSANGLAIIWFMQLRALSYSTNGIDKCANYTAYETLNNMDASVLNSWLDYAVCGYLNGPAEQMFVIMLLVGRYYLPRGSSYYHPNDNINNFLKTMKQTHFMLSIACNGADVLDLINYTRYPGIQGNSYTVGLLLILFSVSVAQFSLNTHATIEQKNSDIYIIVETDLWASLMMLTLDDLPGLGARLYFTLYYKAFSPFGTFLIFKHLLMIFSTLHKLAVLCTGKDLSDVEAYVESEPFSPPPFRRAGTFMGTPDNIDAISDDESLYSQRIPVQSRQEKRKSQWGDKSQWFDENARSQKQQEDMSKSTWDVENGLTVYDPQDETDPTLGSQMWNIGSRTPYFTEQYADEREAKPLTASKVGGKKHIHVPLGSVVMMGEIDFSIAAPKDEAKSRPATGIDPSWGIEEGDLNREKSGKSKKKCKEDEDIDDILNSVDEEPKDRKKKKKDKDDDEEKEEKKKKKKKERDDDDDGEGEGQKDKKKKKKKSKDRDDD